MIPIAALDHLMLTVADIARTREFYRLVLGTGATEALLSIYIRDPDGNLLELSVPAGPWGDGG